MIPPTITPEELMRCGVGIKGFLYWCQVYARVEDKDTHAMVPFELWPAQREVAEMLFRGDWIWGLKARRLGLTWLMVAYALWLVTFAQNRTVVVLNQNHEFAKDFLERVRAMQDALPQWMQAPRVRDAATALSFMGGGLIRSAACTKRAIRSLAADLVIFDEAAYMDLLKTARQAAQPAVETGHGQIVGISTSAGPQGDFYATWRRAMEGKTNYRPVFMHWRGHPGRDDTWYAKEKAENEADPLYMPREYPANPEEAFQAASGRVYPLFTNYGEMGKRFVRRIAVHPDWPKYRGIDWGGVDPFVCLWACVVPGDPMGLTIDPDCTALIDEFLAYSRDDKGAPADKHNHNLDALRYIVVTAEVAGHLHFYRALSIPDSAAKGFALPDLARRIVDMSAGEEYALTVADRSRPDSIQLVRQLGIRAVPQRSMPAKGRAGEIEQGIVRVNALVAGTAKGNLANAIPTKKPLPLNSLEKGF